MLQGLPGQQHCISRRQPTAAPHPRLPVVLRLSSRELSPLNMPSRMVALRGMLLGGLPSAPTLPCKGSKAREELWFSKPMKRAASTSPAWPSLNGDCVIETHANTAAYPTWGPLEKGLSVAPARSALGELARPALSSANMSSPDRARATTARRSASSDTSSSCWARRAMSAQPCSHEGATVRR